MSDDNHLEAGPDHYPHSGMGSPRGPAAAGFWASERALPSPDSGKNQVISLILSFLICKMGCGD